MKKIFLFACLAILIHAHAQSDGISSPLHQKYIGKIVFASNEADIKKNQENESAFINKATLGNPIYFRVYMDNSLNNYIRKFAGNKNDAAITANGTYKIKFYLDGADAGSAILEQTLFLPADKEKWTTFKGALQTAGVSNFIGTNHFANFVKEQEAKLTVGDHQFRMDLLPYMQSDAKEGAVIASGEITLNVGKNIIDANDPKVCLPKSQMADKALEAKILAAFKKDGSFDGVPHEVRITSPKWNISNHKISGAVLNRYVVAVVAVTRDGKCSYREFDVYQDFDGTKYQETLYMNAHLMSEKDINCKCLKIK